ncbi:MAG: hypothetical protein F4X35_10875 [Alphaproteobacteria bacterium]|nr:hypothetical protein [Alphaproteobacteria bacterium]
MFTGPRNDTAMRRALADALADPRGSPEYRRALTTLVDALDAGNLFRNREYQQAMTTMATTANFGPPGKPEACHALAVLRTSSDEVPRSPSPRLFGRVEAFLRKEQVSAGLQGRPAAAWARARAESLECEAQGLRRKVASSRYAPSEETLSRIVELEGQAECWWRGAADLDPVSVSRVAMPERIERMKGQEAKREAEIKAGETAKDDTMKQEALSKCEGDIEAAAALLLEQANDLDRWVSRVEQSGSRAERLYLHHYAAIAHRSRHVAGQLEEERRRIHKRPSRRIDR